MTDVSSSYLITTLIPRIIAQLKQILSRFARDFEQNTEKKGKVKVYGTAANQVLLSNFPHQYQSYSACVNSFVDIARNSPESAIAVLLKLLPEHQDNTLYSSFYSQLIQSSTELLPNILNLIIVLFFADCTAQILTINYDTFFSNHLFELAYQSISPYTEEYEAPLRFTIVKQFSVIFSILSIRHLPQILSEFASVSKVSDLSLFFILYRFIHLSINDRNSYDQFHSFLNDFCQMNPLQKLNKSTPASKSWALAISSLISQVNPKGNQNLTEIFENIYKMSIAKVTGKKPHINHVILCSNIIVRLGTVSGKTCDDFLKEFVYKNKDPHFLEQNLSSFLIIIRGSYVSEFWEWGDFNSNGHPGIELTYLNDPDQDQSLPNSFTNQFLVHFTSQPIEQYPELVGDILLNFASRDFSYFIQSTIPNLRTSLGDDKLIGCLQYCLRTILDPHLHFTEWAQENVRNSSIRIDQSYSLLFNPIKQVIFTDLMKYKPEELLEEPYFFNMTDSRDKPTFQLPFRTESYSKVQKERILNAERSFEIVLFDWNINNNKNSFLMDIKSTSVQQTTDNEMKVIRILELLPHIVNANDLIANEFGMFLIGMILSDSLSISSFAIRVINQIFAANEDTRIIFYECIIDNIKQTKTIHQMFMLLQLLVKLLDLSLTLNCSSDRIQNLINNCQPIILFFLTVPFPDFRDYVIILIERLRNFCLIFNVHLDVDQILTKYNPIISAVVRYKIYKSMGKDIPFNMHTSYITFREACLSRDVELYRYFLVEITTIYTQLVDIKILAKTLKLFLALIGEQPTDIESSEFVHYTNKITVLTHLLPTFSNDEKVVKILESMKTEFYRFPSHVKNVDKEILDDIQDSKNKIISLLRKSLDMISYEQPTEVNKSNVELLRFMNGSTISGFLPLMTEWLTSTPQQKLHSIIPIASEIWKNVLQTSDLVFSLIVNETGKSEIYHFIKILHKYLQDMKLDSHFPNFNEARQDVTVCINYCIIVQNFVDAMNLKNKQLNIGPIYSKQLDNWIDYSWPVDKRRETLTILLHYSALTNNNNEKIPLLRKQAVSSFGSFICSSELFNSDFSFSLNFRNFVIENLEKQGIRVLPSILLHNEEILYDNFVNLMFKENSDISMYYFIAVCSLYYTDLDNEKSDDQWVFHIKDNGNISLNRSVSSELFDFNANDSYYETSSITRLSNMLPKLRVDPLSEEDIKFNKKLMKYSPKLILASFIYLLSNDQYIQKLAFNTLMRIVPNIMTIINPNKPELTLAAMEELDQMSSIFNSVLPSISLDTILKIISIFSDKVPYLTDIILVEAFQLINDAKSSSFISPSTNGILLYIIMPLIEKEASYITKSKENDFPPSLIVMSPLSFIDGLVSFSPKLVKRDINIYISIWDKLASDEQIFDLILNHLLDVKLQNDDENYFFIADTNIYKYIRIIFSRLARINSEKVITALTDRLSFNYWYSTTIRGNTEAEERPLTPSGSCFNYIFSLLAEMMKPFFNQILPRLHLIINFILIHYDQNNSYLTNLMYMILSCFNNCPESLTNIFIPPTSLIWPFELQASDSLIDGNKEFSEAEITLQLFAKNSVPVDSFVKEFIKFLKPDQKTEKSEKVKDEKTEEQTEEENEEKSNKDDESSPNMNPQQLLIENWGKELIEWICGCGDLLLASRASYIFSVILHPITEDTIKCILRSFCIVVKNVNKEDSTSSNPHFQLKNSAQPPQEDTNQPQSYSLKDTKSDPSIGTSVHSTSLFARGKNPRIATIFGDKNFFRPKTQNPQRTSSATNPPRQRKRRLSKPSSSMISSHSLTYIVSILNLLSKYMDAFDSAEDYQKVFMPVYRIAFSFLLVSNKNKHWAHSICEAVLPIITKFIINSGCNSKTLKFDKLILLLSSLTASLKNRDFLYAAFLAIFKHEIDDPNSEYAKTSLLQFFIFIYIALSAYHNISPFSSEMTNSEISKVFQCIPLISSCSFVSNELKQVLNLVFADPASNEPDEFIIKATTQLGNNSSETFIPASESLEKMANECDANSSLQIAIFELVSCLFKAVNSVSDVFVEKYSPIVLNAANGTNVTSSQARELIQSFLQNTEQNTQVPDKIPKLSSGSEQNVYNYGKDKEDEPKLFEKWGSVIRKVERNTDTNVFLTSDNNSFIDQPFVLVPLNCWNSDVSKEIRNVLKNAEESSKYNFETPKKFLKLDEEARNNLKTLSLDDFEPPVDPKTYSAYLAL